MPQPEHHDAPSVSPLLNTLLANIDEVDFLGIGSANPHWRVKAGADTYVWRQFGPDRASPGTDHAREARILAAIAAHPWAPTLVARSPGHGLLFRASSGRHPRPADLSPEQRIALLEAVIECWSTVVDEPPRDYVQLITAYAGLAPASVRRDELVAALIETCAGWNGEDFRLTHHDLHPGNLLLDGNRWTLIDWEYAGVGNPWFDAVALDEMLNLTPDEKSLIAPYLANHSDSGQWQSMICWRNQLNDLWALARLR